MFESVVGQFLGSSQGKDALSQLNAQGLSPQQAQAAVQATAEGAAQHGPSAGLDLGSLLSGGGGGLGGALGSILGSGKTAAPGGAGPGGIVSKLQGPVTQFVASKVGLPPGTAQTVVGVVLPKLMQMVQPGARP